MGVGTRAGGERRCVSRAVAELTSCIEFHFNNIGPL
jgi:hypothetical protein